MSKNKKTELIQSLKEIFDNYLPISDELSFHNKRKDISHIDIEFSGSGDSGAIDSISLMTKEWKEMTEEANQKLENPYRFTSMILDRANNSKYWNYIIKDGYQDSRTDKFYTELEDFVYNFLDNIGHDWYNNEGGQGSIRINFDQEGDINIETLVEINYCESDNYEYKDNYKITNKKVTKKTIKTEK